jgi:hypothetical protein
MSSFIPQHTPGYLEFRRRFKYQVDTDVYVLRAFERHLIESNVDSFVAIDSGFIRNYTQMLLARKKPQSVNKDLKVLSNFFLYLQRMDLCESNPFLDRHFFRPLDFIPYVFSDAEITAVLKSFSDDVNTCDYQMSFIAHLSRHCPIHDPCPLWLKAVRGLQIAFKGRFIPGMHSLH